MTSSTTFRELQQVYRDQITSWWEVQSLESYLKAKIVPRGLRINLLVGNRHKNPTFIHKWEREATESSLCFMQILLEEKATLATLSDKLKEHIEITKSFSKETDFATKETKLQTHIERFQYHLKERKHRQYLRDIQDFKDNKAYLVLTPRDSRLCSDLGIPVDMLPDVRLLNSIGDIEPNSQGLGPFTQLKEKSTKMPPNTGDLSAIDIFSNLVTKELKELSVSHIQSNFNCSRQEMEAIKRLEQNTNIVIKPSDKGGNVVILGIKDYQEMCQSILRDRTTYEILSYNPTNEYFVELRTILQEGLNDGIINKTEFEYMLPKNPVTATFYGLPKSFVKDTPDLLRRLEGLTIGLESSLASIDVEALYSSIPHDRGLEAIQYFLNTRGQQHHQHNCFVLKLLRFCLTHNYFVFDGRTYHQLRGTAMGSPCALAYANLFLGWWEETLVLGEDSEESDSSLYRVSELWTRYIDDILIPFFCLMDGSTMELGAFKYTSEEEERILGGIQGEACFLKTPSILELKRKYESDVKRTINLQLHMMTLGQYYKEGKIPRGLRSSIRPNLFQGNAVYCAQLNIGEFENKIKTLITIEEWNIFKEKVDKEGTKLRNDLEEIKRRKWNRDLEDYETGQIYAWQKENNKPVWKKKGGPWNNQQCGDNKYLTNNDITPYRAGLYHGETIKRKRRGGKRHHRSQKKTREEQNTTSETSNIQEEGSELVINISSKILTPSQIDLEIFFRSIKLKEWFQDRKVEDKVGCGEFNSKNVELKKKSDFIPPTSSTVIDAFERIVRSEVEEIRSEATCEFRYPNITKEEFVGLQELVHDDDIIIKPADKGGAVVIMDRLKYIAEINRQLGDENVYKKLESDPKFKIMGEINSYLQKALNNKIIDQELMDYLSIESPRTPVLYITPKIHKSLVDPPGRPIVADHTSGIRAVDKKLNTTDITPEGKIFIIKLLEIILRRSYFLFGDTFYGQQRGTAMGDNMAPSYANLVMSTLEEDLIYVSHHFRHVLVWWRYIDDVFLLWKDTEQELNNFHWFLNGIDDTIKFTLNYSRTKIQFLDLSVTQNERELTTTLYVKETDKNNLLTYDSQHPRSMISV
ncbi:unnamed protein product [Ranitomeya imitator]|uniref:Reverse transcriptase domain-containing protein n=1 Tax=Ranitomeya imitator TaxID=111125 RepID=A0ABN9LHP0_9NEOB|nr:unnamed protein product [Ranitomeya imitator]